MLKQFFIICSGSDTDILEQCSKGEQNKYAGIGATVFFTAVMAFIAGSYALYTVFDNLYSAIFFGLIWGLLIFNLDRFIVSTIKKRNSVMDELIQATPRIILAVIIAFLITNYLYNKKSFKSSFLIILISFPHISYCIGIIYLFATSGFFARLLKVSSSIGKDLDSSSKFGRFENLE